MEDSKLKGRSKRTRTWIEDVQKDCQARKLNRQDAMDRSRWRKQIGMNDDHDKCEWVNVSSGAGSPGTRRNVF